MSTWRLRWYIPCDVASWLAPPYIATGVVTVEAPTADKAREEAWRAVRRERGDVDVDLREPVEVTP